MKMKSEHVSIYIVKDGEDHLFADTKTRTSGIKVTLEHEESSRMNRIIRIHKDN